MTGKPFLVAAFVAVACLLAVVPLLQSEYWLGVAFIVTMWIALIQSWSLLSATTGYVSLGHAVFYGIGAYVLVVSLDLKLVYVVLVRIGRMAPFGLILESQSTRYGVEVEITGVRAADDRVADGYRR